MMPRWTNSYKPSYNAGRRGGGRIHRYAPESGTPAPPYGPLVREIRKSDLVPGAEKYKDSATIKDCELVASYNWLDKSNPTMLIPGKYSHKIPLPSFPLWPDRPTKIPWPPPRQTSEMEPSRCSRRFARRQRHLLPRPQRSPVPVPPAGAGRAGLALGRPQAAGRDRCGGLR